MNVKRGEIWVASLGPKKGAEVGKQRPVILLQSDLLNDVSHPTVLIAPLSSQPQTESVLRFRVENPHLHKGAAFVLVDQVRTIDAKLRLKKKIGKLKPTEMKTIGRLAGQVLDLD